MREICETPHSSRYAPTARRKRSYDTAARPRSVFVVVILYQVSRLNGILLPSPQATPSGSRKRSQAHYCTKWFREALEQFDRDLRSSVRRAMSVAVPGATETDFLYAAHHIDNYADRNGSACQAYSEPYANVLEVLRGTLHGFEEPYQAGYIVTAHVRERSQRKSECR